MVEIDQSFRGSVCVGLTNLARRLDVRQPPIDAATNGLSLLRHSPALAWTRASLVAYYCLLLNYYLKIKETTFTHTIITETILNFCFWIEPLWCDNYNFTFKIIILCTQYLVRSICNTVVIQVNSFKNDSYFLSMNYVTLAIGDWKTYTRN